jgi:hypothetical protein
MFLEAYPRAEVALTRRSLSVKTFVVALSVAAALFAAQSAVIS